MALSFIVPNSAQPVTSFRPDHYAKGISLKERGEWEAALKMWLAARDSLYELGKSDPRIALAFIELATEKKADQYYSQASSIYFWGFSGDNLARFKEIIRQEYERISPLLQQEEQSEWQSLLDDAAPALFGKIKGFWTQRDPIPTTELNERLIEHWERLAYVREKFTLENTTIYGTDDRGLVFMKYGSPDEKYGGELGSQLLEIMRWFDSFSIRQEIQRFNTTPEFEIWRYADLRQKKTTVFLFGKKAGFGQYGLRYGVEEFIPERAFRRSSMQTTRGVLPGAMLQLMYYRDLIEVDQFYLDRYRELESMWANARGGGRLGPDYDFLRGKISNYKNRDLDTMRFKYLPADKTDAFEGLDPISLKYELFRYLDDDGNSRLSLAVVSSDEGNRGLNYTPFFRTGRKTKYKPRHVLVVYDQEWNLVDRVVDYPALQNTNTSAFSLVQSEPFAYAVVGEKVLMDKRMVQLQQEDIPDTAQVFGVGSAFIGMVPPLSTDSTKFEVSDVLLGVQADGPTAMYPFPVLPKDPMTRQESLLAYLELYNLTSREGKPAKIRIDYEISRLAENEDDEKERYVSNTVQFLTNERRLDQTFQINLQDLVPGDYELRFEITQDASKEKKERTSHLRIFE